MSDPIENKIVVTMARYMSIVGVPLILLTVTWLGTSVLASMQGIAVLNSQFANFSNQIDLKLQIRDQKIDSIDSQIKAIYERLDTNGTRR
jgi:hypothetical protein